MVNSQTPCNSLTDHQGFAKLEVCTGLKFKPEPEIV